MLIQLYKLSITYSFQIIKNYVLIYAWFLLKDDKMMRRHAYLIIAHNEWNLLNKLIKCIDDERNDIFLHIDRKADFLIDNLHRPNKSNLFLINRMNIQWGGDSQVKCEVALLKVANKKGPYAYYHLISGVDLPVRSQNEIHNFFKKNEGNNYIKIDPFATQSGYGKERVRYYYFLQNVIGKKQGHIIGGLWKLNNFLLYIQRKLNIDRLKSCHKKIYKGTNWFSITEEMVEMILGQENFIKKYCYKSLCADEIFVQTLAMNSKLKDTVVDNDLRCIDWKRGNPYIWRVEDVDYLLIQESGLFARKFSDSVDKKASDLVVARIIKSSGE